jgi:hypothetical protein
MILNDLLYETVSLTLRVFENGVLRRIFGLKEDGSNRRLEKTA